ncbi:hypothetical protein [Methylobacterium sp. J-076]|uniref:hypothetical protein n=1 Tax=Methylobacterium sp. J-076 TaxID=2836655 RepID=UPI001FBA486F|nr:hypothetical protein [Methylobacterium sp. J-076]MCJ2011684.1 hypothetical protein [Methylobacterium sp. J-076]
MKLATLACLAALCMTAPLPVLAAPGEPAAAEQTHREPAAAPQKPAAAKPEPASARGEPKADAARAERPGAAPVVVVGRDRRRRSYAACNRASHQRGLRGGKRRRFLIRCRLGYERTRTPQHQTPAAPPAQAPVRKP